MVPNQTINFYQINQWKRVFDYSFVYLFLFYFLADPMVVGMGVDSILTNPDDEKVTFFTYFHFFFFCLFCLHSYFSFFFCPLFCFLSLFFSFASKGFQEKVSDFMILWSASTLNVCLLPADAFRKNYKSWPVLNNIHVWVNERVDIFC